MLPAAVKNIGKCKTVNKEHFSSGFKRGGEMGKKKKPTRKRENKDVLEYVIHSGRNYAVLNTKYVLEWANKIVLHILIFVALTLQFNLKFFKCP